MQAQGSVGSPPPLPPGGFAPPSPPSSAQAQWYNDYGKVCPHRLLFDTELPLPGQDTSLQHVCGALSVLLDQPPTTSECLPSFNSIHQQASHNADVVSQARDEALGRFSHTHVSWPPCREVRCCTSVKRLCQQISRSTLILENVVPVHALAYMPPAFCAVNQGMYGRSSRQHLPDLTSDAYSFASPTRNVSAASGTNNHPQLWPRIECRLGNHLTLDNCLDNQSNQFIIPGSCPTNLPFLLQMSASAAVFYGYVFLVGMALYFILRYFKGDMKLVNVWCIYGE